MEYILLILLLPALLYSCSYARYNWNKKNWKAAGGIGLMVMAAIVLPVTIIILSR